MAQYDTADLLAKCKLYARRPATDLSMPDTSWYTMLTDAQPGVYKELFSCFPDLAYGAPLLMTTADGGLTYGFGAGTDTFARRPMGHAEIYQSLAGIPDDPLVPGTDFLFEGSVIRMLSNHARQFSAGPYARMVLRPDAQIDGTHNPQLLPQDARILLVWRALEAWAGRPGSGSSPVYYEQKYKAAKDAVMLELATAYNRATSQVAGGGVGVWYTRLDLGANLGINN